MSTEAVDQDARDQNAGGNHAAEHVATHYDAEHLAADNTVQHVATRHPAEHAATSNTAAHSTAGLAGVGRGSATGSGLTFWNVIRSEWIKLRTLRSTMWAYILMIVLTIGLALLISAVQGSGASGAPAGSPGATPVAVSPQETWITDATLGILFTQLVVAVLGALVITGEYGTGMIRSSFAAVPSRLPVILGKTLVFGVTTFIVSLFSLVVSALLIVPVLQGNDVSPDLGDGAAWLALVGGAGYVALIGVISLGIGLIVRNSAAGIAASLGLLLIVPLIIGIIGGVTASVVPGNIGTFLPSSVGGALYAYPVTAPAAPSGVIVLGTWESLAVLVGWAIVALIIGSVLVKRRDA